MFIQVKLIKIYEKIMKKFLEDKKQKKLPKDWDSAEEIEVIQKNHFFFVVNRDKNILLWNGKKLVPVYHCEHCQGISTDRAWCDECNKKMNLLLNKRY